VFPFINWVSLEGEEEGDFSSTSDASSHSSEDEGEWVHVSRSLSLFEMKRRKSAEPFLFRHGLIGLRNLGNTCFMNATLQCLAHCEPLAAFFLNGGWKRGLWEGNDSAKGKMATALAELLQKMWMENDTTEKSIDPSSLKALVGQINPYFAGFKQHDAQEFLRFFLDAVHDDVNRVRQKIPYEEIMDEAGETVQQAANRWWNHFSRRNDSQIADVFAGQLMAMTNCCECGNESWAFDPFMDVSLALPRNTGRSILLEECFEGMASDEDFDGDNKLFCGKCKKHQHSKRSIKFFRAPEFLVVHLKRFEQRNALHRVKLDMEVELPVEELDLSPYCHMMLAATRPMYSLCGVVHHRGSLNFGHYTATVRHARLNSWHNFNDDQVTSVDPKEIDGTTAYLLFFKRTDLNRKRLSHL